MSPYQSKLEKTSMFFSAMFCMWFFLCTYFSISEGLAKKAFYYAVTVDYALYSYLSKSLYIKVCYVSNKISRTKVIQSKIVHF